ncbi:MAG: hotdog fold domain-containing protein [Acidimicrobiia bacterium]
MADPADFSFEPRRYLDSVNEIRHYHRVGAEECHYNGYLLSGARLIQYVSDANAELNIRSDGVGGLFASIKSADFLESVYAGEVLEIIVRRVHTGNRSRHHQFEIYKHILKRFDKGRSAAEPLDPPVLVARGSTVSVIPKTPAT